MKPTGNLFFIDDYGVQYVSQWATVGTQIDLTTITRQPHVWGEPDQGYVKNGLVFRRGIITIQRQILSIIPSGYIIVADGSSQYIDFFQTNFPCGGGPVDDFTHHLNGNALDEVEFGVTSGSRWADVTDPTNDANVIWPSLDASGNPIAAVGTVPLTFINVWQ